MTPCHRIENLHFLNERLTVTIDGVEREFVLKEISPLLAGASEEERRNFEVSSSGYGVHWPLLNEDLSIDGLLGIVHKPEFERKSA
jgi:hypothetical protein